VRHDAREVIAEMDQGPIMTKKNDMPSDNYPLKLTQPQREALIHGTRLKRSIRQKLEQAGEGTQTILITRKDLDDLNDEIGQASLYATGPDKKRLIAVLRKVSELFEAIEDAGSRAVTRATTPRPAQTSDLLFQFKITLLDIKPAIWRRILVPDCTLDVLHEYIQAAFGWWNYHLHQFEVEGVRYGPPEPADMDLGLEMEDETKAVLSDLLPKSKRKPRWVYEYDFGDGWRHEIVFENYPPLEKGQKYPLCIEGGRACPPEDVGGPWGYADYLAALADPEHEQHDELLEWRGPFDPEAFDPKKATKEMRKVR
jgi:hypothetical protein